MTKNPKQFVDSEFNTQYESTEQKQIKTTLTITNGLLINNSTLIQNANKCCIYLDRNAVRSNFNKECLFLTLIRNQNKRNTVKIE